jgi:hypothetical protein
VERLRAAIAERDATLAAAAERKVELERAAAEREAELARLRAEREAEREGLHRRLAEREAELQRQSQHDMSDLRRAHLEEARELQAASETSKQALHDELDALREELRDLQLRFEERESRPEDLAQMQAMEAGMREREAMVQKALDEMHYYKLELQNREENYNQLFGPRALAKNGQEGRHESKGAMDGAATMRVGVMNPLAKSGADKFADAARATVNGARKPSFNGALPAPPPKGPNGPLPKLPQAPQAAWGPTSTATPMSAPASTGSKPSLALPLGVPGSPSRMAVAPAAAPPQPPPEPRAVLSANHAALNAALSLGLEGDAHDGAIRSARGRPSSGSSTVGNSSVAGNSARSTTGRAPDTTPANPLRPASSGAQARKWASSAAV